MTEENFDTPQQPQPLDERTWETLLCTALRHQTKPIEVHLNNGDNFQAAALAADSQSILVNARDATWLIPIASIARIKLKADKEWIEMWRQAFADQEQRS